MTSEQKQLLLKDLCARLPYGVKIWIKWDKNPSPLTASILENYWYTVGDDIKPYLCPMSSMTEEEYEDLSNFSELDCGYNLTKTNFFETEGVWSGSFFLSSLIDWLNEHHFDWRGLIEKGLALEATKNMYKTE